MHNQSWHCPLRHFARAKGVFFFSITKSFRSGGIAPPDLRDGHINLFLPDAIKSGFLKLNPINIWDSILLCCGSGPVFCKRCRTIAGIYSAMTTKNVSRQFQLYLRGGGKFTLDRDHWTIRIYLTLITDTLAVIIC